MRSRTTGGTLTAPREVTTKGTASVPEVFGNAAGSTVTVTVAGVTPFSGEIVTPGWFVEIAKSVLFPPGSVILNVCFIAFRLQKLDCTRRSSAETASRLALLIDPTGRIITPLSDTAYIVVAALL